MASKLLTPEQVDIHNEWRKADLAMSRALHKWGDTKTLEDYNAKEKAMDLENEMFYPDMPGLCNSLNEKIAAMIVPIS